MTPVLLERNEFVISFNAATGKIELSRNPHGPETNGGYAILKKMIDGMAEPTKEPVPPIETVDIDNDTDKRIMNRGQLEEYHRQNLKSMVVRDAPFYKRILEVKETSERLYRMMGEDANASDYYRAITWVLRIIDEDTQKPYQEA